MKPPKNRLKLLRVACPNCKAQQDSLNAVCAQCSNSLYSNLSAEELSGTRAKVEALEAVLERIEQGKTDRKDPYKDHDDARKLLKELKGRDYLPGMKDYLAAGRKIQLPFQIHLMGRTVRANIVFSFILLGFAALPFLFKWEFSVSGLMMLPALIWIGITVKAWLSLRKVVREASE